MKLEREFTLYRLHRLNINLMVVMYFLLGGLCIAFSTVNLEEMHRFLKMAVLFCTGGLVLLSVLKPPHSRQYKKRRQISLINSLSQARKHPKFDPHQFLMSVLLLKLIDSLRRIFR
jgi:hypothetical protein